MKQDTITSKGLRTPHGAAIAGIIFAVLLSAAIILVQLSISSDPSESGRWLEGGYRTAVSVALNLVPFAGIAFLWFIGVMRDRLGDLEDKFFSTVFLGSGLLFTAMLFVSAAIAIGMIARFHAPPSGSAEMELWDFGRQMSFASLNLFAARMAGVFMISTSAIGLRTGVLYRWLSYLGLAIALVLLVASGSIPYLNLLFPLWILLVSVNLIIHNLREERKAAAAAGEG